jgi:hypothetical protein
MNTRKRLKIMAIYCFIVLAAVFWVQDIKAYDLRISWSPAQNADHYEICWGTNYQKALNFQESNIENIGASTSHCISGIDNRITLVFVGIRACRASDCSSVVGYYLYGNIWGTFNENTPYTEARNDGQDLSTLGMYFNQTVTQPTYNCLYDFVLVEPTPAQNCDINKDGIINGKDLIEFGLRYKNKAY